MNYLNIVHVDPPGQVNGLSWLFWNRLSALTSGAKTEKGVMQVNFYTKPGCLLCDTVRMELHDLLWNVNFQLQELDITTDESLHARYFLDIPVVEINAGEERVELKAPISQIELRRQLKRLAAQA